MNSFYKDAPDQRCPGCAKLDLDAIFDPVQFEKLPPLSSAGAVPWTNYIHNLGKFTSHGLESGKRESCGLCSFLQIVASISDNYTVPSALAPYLVPAMSKTAVTQEVQDGEGYTLLALSSRFFAQASSRSQNLSITAGGNPGSAEQSSYPSKSAAVWLVLVKGGNTLDRLVYQIGRCLSPNYARSLVDTITIYARNTGTWIAEVTDEIPDDIELTSIRGRLVRPQRIDYGLVQSWLDFCDGGHRSCAPAAARKLVPHMKLIDCETHTLVAAEPSMQYAALSYVWGTAPLEKYIYPNLPDSLPATVADAMTVARELGIRYLWVDRYCIWQDDKTHKKSQILQMTQIYSNAVVTIAAASGPDPLYGLPGVSRGRTRHSQIVGRVGPRVLVSGRIQGRHTDAIERSVWDTRAWTFQEAILSSRILFFSDYEVSLLCSEAECFEHLTHPLDHRNYWGMTKSTYRTNLSTPDGIKSIVLRYSRRKMTFSHDALNAVIGVLSAWSMANDHCYHWWGIPLRFPKSPQKCTDNEVREALWNGLCWRLDSGPVKAAIQRDGFPSWSWLAVDGRTNVNASLTSGKGCGAGYRFEVLEAEKGLVVEWCDFVRNGGLLSQPLSSSPRLHLEGWVFSIGPFHKASFPPQQFYYVTETGGGGQPQSPEKKGEDVLQFMADLGTAGPANLTNGDFGAISTYAGGDGTESYALVFERFGDTGRRVGLLDLQVRSLTDRGIPFVVPQRNSDVAQSFHAKWGRIELI